MRQRLGLALPVLIARGIEAVLLGGRPGVVPDGLLRFTVDWTPVFVPIRRLAATPRYALRVALRPTFDAQKLSWRALPRFMARGRRPPDRGVLRDQRGSSLKNCRKGLEEIDRWPFSHRFMSPRPQARPRHDRGRLSFAETHNVQHWRRR